MLLSYIIFKKAFGEARGEYVYAPENYVPEESDENIMGPHAERFKLLADKNRDLIQTKDISKMSITSDDGLKLNAYFVKNDVPTENTAVLVHGHGSQALCDGAAKAFGFLDAGFNVLMPDNRGCGESEGKWMTFGAKESDDTLLWTKKLCEMYPEGKILVDGGSLGGATVCMLASKDLPQNVKFIVSDCAYKTVEEQFRYVVKKMAHISPDLLKPLFAGVEHWMKKYIGFGFDDIKPVESVKNAKVPMIIVHGKDDRYIPVSFGEDIYAACTTEKKLVIIDDAGHVGSFPTDQEKYMAAVKEFAEKYM